MRVLVSYLGRNQIFSLEEDDNLTKSQMRVLKQKVSSYFEIASTTNFIIQRYDKEWDSYIDLGEQDTLEDRDKLRVTIISECTEAAGKTDVMVIHYDYMYTMNSLYFIIGAVQFRRMIVISNRLMTSHPQQKVLMLLRSTLKNRKIKGTEQYF